MVYERVRMPEMIMGLKIFCIDIIKRMDTTTPAPAPATMNRKTRYYHNHKDEPEFQQRMKDAKRRYYEKNRDEMIAKALNRYYTLKNLQTAQIGQVGQ